MHNTFNSDIKDFACLHIQIKQGPPFEHVTPNTNRQLVYTLGSDSVVLPFGHVKHGISSRTGDGEGAPIHMPMIRLETVEITECIA